MTHHTETQESIWHRTAQEAAQAAFGTDTTLHQTLHRHGVIVWASKGITILAIAGGCTPDAAWRMLVRQITQPGGPTLTTQEVAEVYGVTAGRIRRLVMEGSLIPYQVRDASRVSALFTPEAVWARRGDRRTREERCK